MPIVLIILFYISLPLIFILMVWAIKWISIFISLVKGDAEVIHEIKDSTCDKPKTWGEWFDKLLEPPRQQPPPPPPQNLRHPWRRNNFRR